MPTSDTTGVSASLGRIHHLNVSAAGSFYREHQLPALKFSDGHAQFLGVSSHAVALQKGQGKELHETEHYCGHIVLVQGSRRN
jgi:hypothetical protein